MSTSVPGVPIQARCPSCDASLAEDQHWCLECGTAARTRIAPTPRWRAATLAALAAGVLAVVAISVALARLAG